MPRYISLYMYMEIFRRKIPINYKRQPVHILFEAWPGCIVMLRIDLSSCRAPNSCLTMPHFICGSESCFFYSRARLFFPIGLIQENFFGKFLFFIWAKCEPEYFFHFRRCWPDNFFRPKIRDRNFFQNIPAPPTPTPEKSNGLCLSLCNAKTQAGFVPRY